MKRSIFLLTALTLLGSCRNRARFAPEDGGVPAVVRQADSATMGKLEGIWVDDETDAVLFLIRKDSIIYPDTNNLPARFAVFDDTLVVQSQEEPRYPLKQVGSNTLIYESLSGELMHLHRSTNLDDSLLFLHRQYAPILLGQKVKRDTVVFSPAGDRYHLYIDVNPTTHKVYRTSYTDEGLAVENVYYDNIIHISVYAGRQSVFSRDFCKKDFAELVPEPFLNEAILSNMEFGRIDKHGCRFNATLCEPEGTRCYVVAINVGYDGSKNLELVDY